MFDTPYQTTSMRKTALNQQGLARLRNMEINGELMDVGSRFKIRAVKPSVMAMDVLPFTLPLTKVQMPTMEVDVIIDARSMLRANGEPIKRDAWEHLIRVAELTAWWETTDPHERTSLLSIGNYAMQAYIGWISNTLVSSLNLDIRESLLLRATVGVFYAQLHLSGDELKGNDYDRILTRVSRSLAKMDSHTLSTMLGEIPRLKDVNEWLVWATQILGSPKFDRMTVGVLLNMVNSTWGPGYTDQVRAAVEYPPIFNALVYSTLSDRAYAKTRMGDLLFKIVRSSEDKDFVKSINHLLRG